MNYETQCMCKLLGPLSCSKIWFLPIWIHYTYTHSLSLSGPDVRWAGRSAAASAPVLDPHETSPRRCRAVASLYWTRTPRGWWRNGCRVRRAWACRSFGPGQTWLGHRSSRRLRRSLLKVTWSENGAWAVLFLSSLLLYYSAYTYYQKNI